MCGLPNSFEFSSNFPINRFAYAGTIFVPIAVPWICRYLLLNSNTLFLGLYQSIRLKRLVLVVRIMCNYLDCFVNSIIHFVYHHCVECWCTVRIRLWMPVNSLRVFYGFY